MFKPWPGIVLAGCTIIAVSILLLKLYFPQFIYFNSGLMLVIMLTIFLNGEFYTYLFTAAVFLIVMASMYFYKGAMKSDILANQILAGFTIMASTILVVHSKRLSQSEKIQLSALFEHASEGIIQLSQSGEIVMINPEAQKQFLYELNDLLGKKIDVLIPQRSDEAYYKYQHEFNAASTNRNMLNNHDLFAVKKNGMEFPVEVGLSHFNKLKDKFVLVFIRDITHRKESENNLMRQTELLEKGANDMRKMNIELENKVSERTLILQEALQELERSQQELSEALEKEKELNEIKSRFVSMASHEFRTPLSTILSSVSLISKYKVTEDDEKREKHVYRIKNSVKHLTELLEDFLNIGKIEEGHITTEILDFNLKDFIDDVNDEMEAGLKQGQEIKVNLKGGLSFRTDKRLLKNIMINLLSNAIKFSEAGNTIYVDIENSGLTLNMQIRDQGMGIPPEDLPRLFSSFYRGRNVVNIQGTGLGLHIVKRYIDMLHGNITLSSEINVGTTFNLVFPIVTH